MKILSMTVCVALLAWSQDRPPLPATTLLKDQTGRWNGRLWKSFSPSDKAVFLMAYSNAVDQVSLMATKGSKSSNLNALFFPATLTGTEVSSALDRFYDAPENVPVAIVDALMGVSRRSNRLTVENINKILDDPCGN